MTGRMFPFVTETWNPVRGSCPYDCSYCWAKTLIKRHNYAKYQGETVLDDRALGKIPDKGFVFVQDMSDISVLLKPAAYVLSNIFRERPEATYLLLTKNPNWYYMMQCEGVGFPDNVILGATIETNREIPVSKAPHPLSRFDALNWLSKHSGKRLFISIEPIMEFDYDQLLKAILKVKPWAVAVGYDNYRNGLPEPNLAKVMLLISQLRVNGITVYEKTLREASA